MDWSRDFISCNSCTEELLTQSEILGKNGLPCFEICVGITPFVFSFSSIFFKCLSWNVHCVATLHFFWVAFTHTALAFFMLCDILFCKFLIFIRFNLYLLIWLFFLFSCCPTFPGEICFCFSSINLVFFSAADSLYLLYEVQHLEPALWVSVAVLIFFWWAYSASPSWISHCWSPLHHNLKLKMLPMWDSCQNHQKEDLLVHILFSLVKTSVWVFWVSPLWQTMSSVAPSLNLVAVLPALYSRLHCFSCAPVSGYEYPPLLDLTLSAAFALDKNSGQQLSNSAMLSSYTCVLSFRCTAIS